MQTSTDTERISDYFFVFQHGKLDFQIQMTGIRLRLVPSSSASATSSMELKVPPEATKLPSFRFLDISSTSLIRLEQMLAGQADFACRHGPPLRSLGHPGRPWRLPIHSYNRIHRRPDVMAHIGQELALGAACRPRAVRPALQAPACAALPHTVVHHSCVK